MKVLIIGNPIAGGGRAKAAIYELGAVLTGRGHEVEFSLTQARGDAAGFARELGPDAECLVVAGGDGTVNEVINGLADPGAVPILQMPFGTANMLACELGLPKSPAEFAALVESGTRRRVDLCTIRSLAPDASAPPARFLLVASAGFDAMVTRTVAETRTGTMGFHAYARPILATLRRYAPPRLCITVDDGAPLEGAMAILGKTQNYGRIFSFTPRAALDSGAIEVCVLKNGEVAALSAYALKAYFKMDLARSGAMVLRGRRVRIESAGPPCAVQADGDWWGVTPVEAVAEPGALCIVAP